MNGSVNGSANGSIPVPSALPQMDDAGMWHRLVLDCGVVVWGHSVYNRACPTWRYFTEDGAQVGRCPRCGGIITMDRADHLPRCYVHTMQRAINVSALLNWRVMP